MIVGTSRVVAYARQLEGEPEVSVELQHATIRTWAAQRGHELVGTHSDVGRLNKIGLERCTGLLSAVQVVWRQHANVLAMTSFDRLAVRPALRSAFLQRLMMRNGGCIAFTSSIAGAVTPESRLAAEALATMSETELFHQSIRRRMRGLNSAPRALPTTFGYQPGPEGTVIANPAEQLVIAKIWEMRTVEAKSWEGIVEKLEEMRARPRGTKWHTTTVRRIHEAEYRRRWHEPEPAKPAT